MNQQSSPSLLALSLWRLRAGFLQGGLDSGVHRWRGGGQGFPQPPALPSPPRWLLSVSMTMPPCLSHQDCSLLSPCPSWRAKGGFSKPEPFPGSLLLRDSWAASPPCPDLTPYLPPCPDNTCPSQLPACGSLHLLFPLL